MILILFLALMYKTMGGGSWTGLWREEEAATATEAAPPTPAPKAAEELPMEETIEAVTGQFSLAWQSLKGVSTSNAFEVNWF